MGSAPATRDARVRCDSLVGELVDGEIRIVGYCENEAAPGRGVAFQNRCDYHADLAQQAERQHLDLAYVQACVRVAAMARLFANTADDAPLKGLTSDQGFLWDDLTAALSVLDELEADADLVVDESASQTGVS